MPKGRCSRTTRRPEMTCTARNRANVDLRQLEFARSKFFSEEAAVSFQIHPTQFGDIFAIKS
jgi:hypothetical protein